MPRSAAAITGCTSANIGAKSYVAPEPRGVLPGHVDDRRVQQDVAGRGQRERPQRRSRGGRGGGGRTCAAGAPSGRTGLAGCPGTAGASGAGVNVSSTTSGRVAQPAAATKARRRSVLPRCTSGIERHPDRAGGGWSPLPAHHDRWASFARQSVANPPIAPGRVGAGSAELGAGLAGPAARHVVAGLGERRHHAAGAPGVRRVHVHRADERHHLVGMRRRATPPRRSRCRPARGCSRATARRSPARRRGSCGARRSPGPTSGHAPRRRRRSAGRRPPRPRGARLAGHDRAMRTRRPSTTSHPRPAAAWRARARGPGPGARWRPRRATTAGCLPTADSRVPTARAAPG